MTANPHLRNLLGLILGGCAGLSLAVSVLPTVLHLGRIADEPALLRALAPLWPWSTLVGAAGGFGVARTGGVRIGGIVLAVAGAAAALLVTGLGLGARPAALAMAAAAGAAYGGFGGLILGRILGGPGAPDEGPPL
jgi:hypothetical protein